MADRLRPLQNSHEASELEAELKDLFIKVYADTMASTADDINAYGAPHLGSFGLVERNIDRDGLSVLRETTEARIRYLFRSWRHLNPERGLHFLRLYLSALFGDAWVAEQLWQRKDQPYPTALATTAEVGDSRDYFLTSRVRVDVDSEIVPAKILSSLRSAIAARILLTVRIGRTFRAGVGVAALGYGWHVFRIGKYGAFDAPTSLRRQVITEDGHTIITEIDARDLITENSPDPEIDGEELLLSDGTPLLLSNGIGYLTLAAP